MTWTTIEHLLNHDQAVERVAERLNNSPLMLDWIDDRAYDEWNGVNDPEDLAEGVMNQLYGVEGQFQYVTAEALDALPDQAYQDLIDSEFMTRGTTCDDVATALSATEQRNGDVLTSQEVLETLPYFGVEKPAPILDDYDASLPTFVATHEGPMNPTQEAYNQLSPIQQQFLATASEGVGRSFVVDSTREFAHGAEQFRSDNPIIQSPYSDEENIALINELFNLQEDENSLQQ